MSDLEKFPHPVYRDTVLAPLFEGVKTHHAAHMQAINEAHLVMLAETGILPAAGAAQIARALAEIAKTDPATLTYTGEYEDYFFHVESELKRHIGDLGGMLHTARSRNDMDHTLFKMALRDRTDALLTELSQLAHAILTKAQAEATTPVVAYTHGQPAQVSTFGHYLSAALEILLSDIARIVTARASLDLCPMGAAAITTSGFPVDRHRMADLLGFTAPRRNSYGCIASVDYITGLYSALKLPFLHLGRLVQDFQFWTAFEVGQLWLPGSLVQISSIMPQKRNPVPIEHLRHLMSVTMGRCDTIVNTMHNTPFTDMNDSEGEVQEAGYSAFSHASRATRLLGALIPAVSIRADRVRAISDAACATVTELADTLVRIDGLSFRQAHHIAAITSKGVIARSSSLSDGHDLFVQAFREETGRDSKLTDEDYREAVSPEGFISRRDRFGGPAIPAMAEAFAAYTETLAGLDASIATGPAQLRDAAAARNQAFARLRES